MKYIYLIAIIMFIVPLTMASDLQKLPLKDGKTWAYSITFDDGKKSVYDSAFPTLEKYNYTAGLAVITKRADLDHKDFLNWNDILYLYANDWDILSHSISHFSAKDSSYEKIDYEIKESKSKIESEIPGFSVSGFVYPFGDISKNSVYLVNRYYYFGEANFLNEEYIDFESFDPETINRRPIYGNASKYNWRFDDISKYSKTKPLWLIEYTHGVFDEDNLVYDTNSKSFKDHISYLYNNYGAGGTDEVWVAPSREVYDYYLVYNHATIKNFSEDSNKIEFYVDMASVPEEVENKEISLRLYTDVKKIYNGAELIDFKMTGNYVDFNVKEGYVKVLKTTDSPPENPSNNSTEPSNNSSDNSSNGKKDLPKVDLNINPKKIQFNGWTNMTWNIEEADQLCVKMMNPMNKYVIWDCNDSGSLRLKANEMYYAGNYSITIKATNAKGVTELNDSFEVVRWSEREKNSPSLNLDFSKDQINEGDSITLNWASEDDSQIIASYIYLVDEPYSTLVFQSHKSEGKMTIDSGDLPKKGNYRVYLRAKDSANNWAYVNKSFTFS